MTDLMILGGYLCMCVYICVHAVCVSLCVCLSQGLICAGKHIVWRET